MYKSIYKNKCINMKIHIIFLNNEMCFCIKVYKLIHKKKYKSCKKNFSSWDLHCSHLYGDYLSENIIHYLKKIIIM